MLSLLRTTFLIAAVLFGFVVSPGAVLIDFEDVVGGQPEMANVFDIQSDGFNFQIGSGHSHLLDDSYFGSPSNGTTHLALDDDVGDNPVTMTSLNGRPFSLESLDFAEFYLEPSTRIEVTGLFPHGGSISEILTPDEIVDGIGGVADFETAFFDSSWSDLSSVTLDSVAEPDTHQGWALDNIVVTVIPEPASLLLVGTCLAGLAAMRRKSKNH